MNPRASFRTWEEAHAYAARVAAELQQDIGIEHNALYREWVTLLLPKPENRRGYETRCEVVRPGDPP